MTCDKPSDNNQTIIKKIISLGGDLTKPNITSQKHKHMIKSINIIAHEESKNDTYLK